MNDLDDWDIEDKTFHWLGIESPKHFDVNTQSGIITMVNGTSPGIYTLQFLVYDRVHGQQNVPANVSVHVLYISEEEVRSSASVRLRGITDEDFIRVYHYKVCTII